MAISDKLNYLIETKSKFKDRLNSLGAEIINSTTFRNYMVWVNDFYNKASDKTYLAETGIVGRTSQSGTPTPDSPQSINNLTGDVRFTIGREEESENLFDDSTKNDTWVYQYGTGIYTERSFGSNCISIDCVSGDTYTLSATFSGTDGAIAIAFFDADFNGLDYHQQSSSQNMTITATAPENTAFMSAGHASEEPTSITLVKGSGSSGSSKTFTIPLGDIELCKIDTYEDKIYSSNGRFYLEKKIEKHLFTTNDIVSKGSSSPDGYARCGWGLYSKIAVADLGKTLVRCNKFLGMSQNDNSPSLTGEHWYCSLSNNDNYKIMFRCGNTEYTRDTFPNFIKNNGIIVYYPLKEPTTTEITSSNYPELYSVLKEIQDYLTQYKINKEFLLDYSSPEITY